jgi:hypothetical protein
MLISRKSESNECGDHEHGLGDEALDMVLYRVTTLFPGERLEQDVAMRRNVVMIWQQQRKQW